MPKIDYSKLKKNKYGQIETISENSQAPGIVNPGESMAGQIPVKKESSAAAAVVEALVKKRKPMPSPNKK